MNRYKIGRNGEDIANNYLLEKGFKIIQSNFHTPYGEIDIICEKNSCIYFYEVKYRRSNKFGNAEESISQSKVNKLKKSIEVWLQQEEKNFQINEILLNALIIDSNNIMEFEIN